MADSMKAPTYRGGLTADGAMTIKECCRVGGAGRKLWMAEIERGNLPAIRIGRRVLVPRRAFYKFLEDRTTIAPRRGGPRLKSAS